MEVQVLFTPQQDDNNEKTAWSGFNGMFSHSGKPMEKKKGSWHFFVKKPLCGK